MLSSQVPQPIALQQPISQNTEDSAHGSLLYTAVSVGRMHTAASAGNTSVVKMLTDPSFQMLEALHPFSKETPLDAANRNCHVYVVIEASH